MQYLKCCWDILLAPLIFLKSCWSCCCLLLLQCTVVAFDVHWCFFGVSFKDQGLARKRDLQRGSFKSNKVSISEFKSCKYAMFWKPLELWWQFLKEGFNSFSQFQNNQTSLIFCFFFVCFFFHFIQRAVNHRSNNQFWAFKAWNCLSLIILFS